MAPEGTPWADGLTRFASQVKADSQGRVDVRPFLGGVLGDENESVQSVQRGQIQGVGASTGALASIVPELNVLELPYLFKSAEEADYVLDKVVLSSVEKLFADRGLILGFWSENGYRCFGSNWGADAIRRAGPVGGRLASPGSREQRGPTRCADRRC